jgi:hypothetical protein
MLYGQREISKLNRYDMLYNRFGATDMEFFGIRNENRDKVFLNGVQQLVKISPATVPNTQQPHFLIGYA